MNESRSLSIGRRGWLALAIAILLGAAVLWIGVARNPRLPQWLSQAAYVLAALMCLLCHRCAKRAKQFSATNAIQLLSKDKRKPVLYLRSFGDDQHGASYARTSPLVRSTNEEQLAEVLTQIGPVVAIGRPGDKLPQLGAARQYVDDDKWQAHVTKFMRRARLVVIRIGQTEGLWWEIETAIALVKAQRLVLLVPSDVDCYDSFRSKAAELFPHPLPTMNNTAPCKPAGRHFRYGLWGIIAFESDWKPRFCQLYAPLWRLGVEKPLIPNLQFAFRSVFDALGLPWMRPTLNLGAIIVTILFCAWAFVVMPSAITDFIRWINR